MSSIETAVREIRRMDELSARDQWVNRLHPLVKLLCTILFIVITVSFGRYDVIGTISMGVYPLVLFQLTGLRFGDCVRRLRAVLPIVLLVGLANPFLDRQSVLIGSFAARAGVLSMITLILKGCYSLLASYLLVATTPVERLCAGLRRVGVPSVLVTEVLLIYRYVQVLLQEAGRIYDAYSLRAPGQKGIHYKAWGSLLGQLLLRSMDRAQTVYESMTLRGFRGEFTMDGAGRVHVRDAVYLAAWCSVFFLLRRWPVLVLIGRIFV